MKTLQTIAFILFVMTFNLFAQSTPLPLQTGVSRELAKWRAANYSDVRYKLNITLEKGAPLMKGNIEIRVNLSDEAIKSPLILDWRTTQFAGDKDKPFANVVAVNDALDISSQINQEHILIPNGLLKKGENVIKIEFASPIKTSGAAVTRYVDKEDGAEYVYSLFVPSDASTAFPVFDQPDLKARFSLIIDAPKDWKVISNTDCYPEIYVDSFGNRSEASILKEGKWRFYETKPISTYVFAFAAGDFATFQDGFSEPTSKLNKSPSTDTVETLPDNPEQLKESLLKEKSRDKSRIYVRKSQAEKFKKESAEVFRLNREGVKFLESWFDYKFPFPKYDLVLIPEFPFGGMEHAGATFLREDRVIFPTEPTKNDYITRTNVIFHEAAHQWFGDTVTMRWFDDLWLKEGFAEFMAYKTMEKVLPGYNAWKIFYERNKQATYLTDVTPGTTPIYQEIPNLSSAKSAYGNIVYRKAPSFLRQAEFFLGEKEFQMAVRQFLKKHEFANAGWTDLVKEFETVSISENMPRDVRQKVRAEIQNWAKAWVNNRGLPVVRVSFITDKTAETSKKENPDAFVLSIDEPKLVITQENSIGEQRLWQQKFIIYYEFPKGKTIGLGGTEGRKLDLPALAQRAPDFFVPLPNETPKLVFPNYQDYGYGIFLLDRTSRAYVLANIQTEKDDFLRSMMWGNLWDSLRFYELAPEDYVKLVIKDINVESDESTIQSLLNRVSTAMNYYLSDAQAAQFAPEIEKLLIDKMQNAPTLGERITFYRSFVALASTENARIVLKDILSGKLKIKDLDLKSKDKFDIVTKLIALDDADGLKLLAELEKQYTDDAAKRYAYAAQAGIPTAENKLKYWRDFTENKEISESYIESAFAVWNSPRQADLTLPYLEKALAELPNLKKRRKIFFVNGWLAAFVGGQKSETALNIVNKFLADNSKMDKDLRLKILENADNLERAVKIREKYEK